MADEPSLGEVSRTVDRLERQWAAELGRVRAEHDTDIRRLEREHSDDLRKLREDVIKPLKEDVEALQKRPALTVGRIVAMATAMIALAALLVQAYGVLKGAK